MKKKELGQMKIRMAEPEDTAFAERVLSAYYFVSAEKCKCSNISTLVLNFYSREELVSGVDSPVFRVFFQNEDYITQMFKPAAWRTGIIYKLLWEYSENSNQVYNWEMKTVSLNNATEQILKEYFKDYFCLNLKNKGVFSAITRFQEAVLNKRKLARHQKEKDKIDRKMNEITELPDDFLKWCDETALFQSRYIFYNNRNGTKPVQGYCTCCHNDVMVAGPRHNEYGTCPSCGKTIQYKVKGRSKKIRDWQNVAYFQKVKDGFCIRYFKIEKQYISDYKMPDISYFEDVRAIYYRDKWEYYIFGSFKCTFEYRWCKNNKQYYRANTVVYADTIESSLQNTKWKYCALKEFVSRDAIQVDIPKYLTMYLNYPYIEKFVKTGLYRLTSDLINPHIYSYHNNDIEVQPDKDSLTKLLDITKTDLQMFREMDISKRELQIFQKAQSEHIRLNIENIKQLSQYGSYAKEFLEYLKYTTFQKLNHYLKKQSAQSDQSLETIWVLWRDMVCASQSLQIDLRNPFNLFPKHLIKIHDEVSKRWGILKDQIKKKERQQLERKAGILFKKLKPQYEWQNEEYAILVPNNFNDFQHEGETLHICVGINGYFESMAEGKTIILFLRRKSEIDKPFYTVEIKNFEIIQCQTFGHKEPTPEIRGFMDQYLKELANRQIIQNGEYERKSKTSA